MSNQIYQEDEYKIYKAGNSLIVHNSKQQFTKAHTHVRSMKTAKSLIYYCKNQIIPRKYSQYLLGSLIRISSDEEYINKLEELIQVRQDKGKKECYINNTRGR